MRRIGCGVARDISPAVAGRQRSCLLCSAVVGNHIVTLGQRCQPRGWEVA